MTYPFQAQHHNPAAYTNVFRDPLMQRSNQTLTVIKATLDPRYSWCVSSQLVWMSKGWAGQQTHLEAFLDGLDMDLARLGLRQDVAS